MWNACKKYKRIKKVNNSTFNHPTPVCDVCVLVITANTTNAVSFALLSVCICIHTDVPRLNKSFASLQLLFHLAIHFLLAYIHC